MRRPSRLLAAPLLAAVALATPALIGTSSAAPAGHGRGAAPVGEAGHGPGHASGRQEQAKPAEPAEPGKQARVVVVVGTVSATTTVDTSATPTVSVVVTVRGGKDHRTTTSVPVRLAATTAVTGNAGHGAGYVPQVGDRVTVHAVRGADGALVATRVTATRSSVPAAGSGSATATVSTR